MKNVVMEIQGKNAVLMNEAGDFLCVKNKNYEVGQRLESNTIKKSPALARWAVAAAAVVALLVGGGAYAYYTPYTYVSFDINPSIEISTNIFDRIIDVAAINEDAEALLEQLQLDNCDMQTAMTKLVDELIDKGYLTSEEAAEIMITTSSQDQERAQVMLQDMTKDMKRQMDQNRVHADIQGECVGNELRIRAREYGVTPGKLMLAERYAQSTGDPSAVSINEWLGKSVKEIVAATKINQQQNDGGAPAGSQNENGNAAGDANSNGYNGGDTGGNGYNGGDQSGNGANAGSDSQNGYLGGEKSDNGYNGGEEINNDENSQTPGNTSSPEASKGRQSSPSPSAQNNGANQSGSGSGAGGRK